MAKGEIRTKITFDFGQVRTESERVRRELNFTSIQLREYEYILRRTLSLIKRFGLPEDFNQAITTIQRMIRIFHQLYMTSLFAQAILTGPAGWVSTTVGLLHFGSAIATMSDLS